MKKVFECEWFQWHLTDQGRLRARMTQVQEGMTYERQRDEVGRVYGRIEEAVRHPGLSAELRLEAGKLQAVVR